MQSDLLLALKIYQQQGYNCSISVSEKESKAYGAYDFTLKNHKIKYRIAKTTPTKAGQFVTLWKRINNGPIQPFDSKDEVDFFIISVRKEGQFGQFVFPKSVLMEKGIVTNLKEGKRAFRVYLPWEENLNKQAQKTQRWQLNYFIDFTKNKTVNLNHIFE